ncbi:MAG TPA: FtsH protease activity modulator HflK [Candidatus Caccomorpha excrementavium]|nr:FtsH protease activity modulator HflK [Candidatus Caccomorpha excrementavium]
MRKQIMRSSGEKEKRRKDMRSSKKVPRVGSIIVVAILVVAAAILIFDSAYSITEQEQAVVTTFGKPMTVNEPGLHFKIPIIQKVQKVDTTIKGFPIGYSSATEYVEEESLMITNDFNFVNVDFYVEYKVSDPVKALFSSQEPVEILKNLAQSSIRSVVGSFDVDSVITTGKGEIQSKIKDMIIEKLEEHDIGIQLINITIQDAEPPTDEVMEAFKQVETAKQGKDTAINNANKYRNEQLPEAEARIDQILKDAQAQKEARINEAEGQVARFNSMYEEYSKNPLITKQRMFYETMEEILPELEVILDSTDTGVQKILPLDPIISSQTE